ncbi:MAG TPA: STAS domain-containing protein [Actinomycetota bacterium]|nr:STAS domain-containing protein [Actinomycetota bacterium]
MGDRTIHGDLDDERRSALEVHDGPEGRRVVRVIGALDLATSDRVEAALRAAFDDGEAVRLDLSKVTFLDSSGMRGVLRAYRLARDRDIVFEVVPGPPAVQRVLRITGVDARLTFVEGGPADGRVAAPPGLQPQT